RTARIPAFAAEPRDFGSRDTHEAELFGHVARVEPDLVVCAGYMRLIGATTVEAWTGRMVNIHPSLLPAFKGLHTHRQALQARVPVLPGDDEPALAARVLGREHPLLVATLRLLASRRVQLAPSGVLLDGEPLAAPLRLDSAGVLHRPDLQPD